MQIYKLRLFRNLHLNRIQLCILHSVLFWNISLHFMLFLLYFERDLLGDTCGKLASGFLRMQRIPSHYDTDVRKDR